MASFPVDTRKNKNWVVENEADRYNSLINVFKQTQFYLKNI